MVLFFNMIFKLFSVFEKKFTGLGECEKINKQKLVFCRNFALRDFIFLRKYAIL